MVTRREFVAATFAAVLLLAMTDRAAGSQTTPDQFRIIAFNGGTLALPTAWKGIVSGDGKQFSAEAPDGQIRAMVSIYYFSPGAPHAADKQVFDRFLTLRLQAERAASAGIVISTPSVLTQQDGTMTATFEGRESAVRRFAGKLAMRGGTLAVVYLEALGQDNEACARIVPLIFEGIAVHER
jgi:hypothetical protein